MKKKIGKAIEVVAGGIMIVLLIFWASTMTPKENNNPEKLSYPWQQQAE